MKEKFDIQSYMTNGVFKIVKEAIKAALKNPKESLFLASFMTSVNKASEKRKEIEKLINN